MHGKCTGGGAENMVRVRRDVRLLLDVLLHRIRDYPSENYKHTRLCAEQREGYQRFIGETLFDIFWKASIFIYYTALHCLLELFKTTQPNDSRVASNFTNTTIYNI